jgi:hypothetical protein
MMMSLHLLILAPLSTVVLLSSGRSAAAEGKRGLRIADAGVIRGEAAKTPEDPAFCPVFPYALCVVGNEHLVLGRACRSGCRQDPIQAAYPGVAYDADRLVAEWLAATRPAFWDQRVRWMPVKDNGEVACVSLQSMPQRLQWRGDLIHVHCEDDVIRELGVELPARLRDVVTHRPMGDA